eukprot:581348-Amphidinium_carterae.1
MKSIEDRGRQAADALVTAFQRRSSLRSASQKSAEQVEIERLKHERELIIAEREAAHQQILRAAEFCGHVRDQALEHQERMKNEAQVLCQHVARERQELLSSCNRKAEETVNMLRSQLEAEKANVAAAVERQLLSEREKMARDLQAQQEVSLGGIRTEFEKAQHEIDGLRSQAEAAERERDASMQQLAAERIRTSQMQTHGSQVVFERDTLSAQFLDLARHAAASGACQDIQWTGNREPEGFSDFVERVQASSDGEINAVPPFANQQSSAPPGLFNVENVANIVPAPQTPERRPKASSSSPMFGKLFENLFGNSRGRGGGNETSNGAHSIPDGVEGSPYSRSGRSDRNPRM